MACLKRRWVVSWLAGGVEGVVADHGVQSQIRRWARVRRAWPAAVTLVKFALLVGPRDGVGAQ